MSRLTLWETSEERERERGKGLTVHPLPIDHPITPQAFPFARICRGKISA